MMDSQLRMTLQWLSASEVEVAELHFHGDAPKEFVIVSSKNSPYKLQSCTTAFTPSPGR